MVWARHEFELQLELQLLLEHDHIRIHHADDSDHLQLEQLAFNVFSIFEFGSVFDNQTEQFLDVIELNIIVDYKYDLPHHFEQ